MTSLDNDNPNSKLEDFAKAIDGEADKSATTPPRQQASSLKKVLSMQKAFSQ